MENRPLTKEDFDCSVGWIKESVQSAKRLLKQMLDERIRLTAVAIANVTDDIASFQSDEIVPQHLRRFIVEAEARLDDLKQEKQRIDACFQIDDGKEAKE